MRTLPLKVGALKAALIAGLIWAMASLAQANAAGLDSVGLEVRDVTSAEAARLGFDTPHGVWVTKIVQESTAAVAGVLVGDVIITMDRQEIENAATFTRAVSAKAIGAQMRLRWVRPQATSGGAAQKELTAVLTMKAISDTVSAPLELITTIETGGHQALIKSVRYTPDGKYLVSAGNDKQIRVWDANTGKFVRLIRINLPGGSNGKIYSLAISPNGKLLAVAGYTPNDELRLLDFETGQVVRLLKGHTDVVSSVAFSPDGKRLISGGADRTAIIWDVATGNKIATLGGHQGEIYAVGFSLDSQRAITTSFDTKVRLWTAADGKLIKEMPGHTNKIRALAVHPKDGTFVTGGYEGDIRLWNSATGQALGVMASQGTVVGALTYSPDGKRLISTCGGGYPCVDHVWDATQRPYKDLGTHQIDNDIAPSVAVSPDGRWAATAGGSNQVIQIWDPGLVANPNSKVGQVRMGPDSKPMTLVGVGLPGWAVGISSDGTTIGWGHTWTHESSIVRGPLQFQLRLPVGGKPWGAPEPVIPTESASDQVPADQMPVTAPPSGKGAPAPTPATPGVIRASSGDIVWRRAQLRVGSVTLSHRPGGSYGDRAAVLGIARNGAETATITKKADDGYEHRAYTLTADGKTIVSGGNNGALMAYDLDGKRLIEFVGHTGDVWSVATSADGRFLVSGSADQTIRLWPLSKLSDSDVGDKKQVEPIFTLFHGTDDTWVAWSPLGYFMGSDDAGRRVGWQINRSDIQLPSYVSADQLYKKLLRPDILARAIALGDARAAANEKRGNFNLEDIYKRPTPIIEVKTPANGYKPEGGQVRVQLTIGQTPDPVRSYRISVNGATIEDKPAGKTSGTEDLLIPLAAGKNTIVVRAINDQGESAPEAGTFTVENTGPGLLSLAPGKLYILAIGASKYPNLAPTCGLDNHQPCDLALSGNDAISFADMMEKRLSVGHTSVDKRVLFNGAGGDLEPTSANIRNELSRLQTKAQFNDTVVLFIAGHGVNAGDGQKYLFLPSDARRIGADWVGSTTLAWTELEADLVDMKGRRILFVDTCHSAGALNEKLGYFFAHEKIVAFTATDRELDALESSRLGHGLFTAAVLAGLEGEADVTNARRVSVVQLSDFLKTKTAQLMKTYFPTVKKPWPEPKLHKSPDTEDYMIASW